MDYRLKNPKQIFRTHTRKYSKDILGPGVSKAFLNKIQHT